MKKLNYSLLAVLFFFLNFGTLNSQEKKANCVTGLQKLNPECNFIGKSFKKIKKFSSENKTIDQTYRNIKKKSNDN